MNNKFYRYIYEKRGGYTIEKDHEYYGWYDNLPDALYDRDCLERVNWDLGEFVYLPVTDNPYEDMILPSKSLDRERQYIYSSPNGWRIQKKINGKSKYFGSFKTLDEAKKERNRLIENGWCKT